MIKKWLTKIDTLLSRYLGLERTELTPQILEKKEGKLLLVNTESFKRHTHAIPIDKINLKSMTGTNREKLGIAIGKMIANHLVVSFDEIIIKREKTHAG